MSTPRKICLLSCLVVSVCLLGCVGVDFPSPRLSNDMRALETVREILAAEERYYSSTGAFGDLLGKRGQPDLSNFLEKIASPGPPLLCAQATARRSPRSGPPCRIAPTLGGRLAEKSLSSKLESLTGRHWVRGRPRKTVVVARRAGAETGSLFVDDDVD